MSFAKRLFSVHPELLQVGPTCFRNLQSAALMEGDGVITHHCDSSWVSTMDPNWNWIIPSFLVWTIGEIRWNIFGTGRTPRIMCKPSYFPYSTAIFGGKRPPTPTPMVIFLGAPSLVSQPEPFQLFLRPIAPPRPRARRRALAHRQEIRDENGCKCLMNEHIMVKWW